MGREPEYGDRLLDMTAGPEPLVLDVSRIAPLLLIAKRGISSEDRYNFARDIPVRILDGYCGTST